MHGPTCIVWANLTPFSLQDSGRNGKDAQLHALAALLSTGPVGLGDTCVGEECMVNATLVHRLARADGILCPAPPGRISALSVP